MEQLVFVAAAGVPSTALIVAGVIVVILLVTLGVIKNLLYICRPDEVLIFSGRETRLMDGTKRGFRVVFGGRGWRVPLVERVDRMSLNIMEVPISIRNAYSQGGIPLSVDAIANVKISSDEGIIGNAIERFLGRDPEEIRRVAKETLEGHLRGVLATLTPEEVNEDRLKFAGELSRESEEDLNKLGIHLDTFKVQHVSDEVRYLDSIGRQAIATVVRNAEMAESDAKRDAEQAEAVAAGRANVTTANMDAKIAQMKNELRRIRAELESQVKAEEERTLAAAREARASAEQELQAVRAELEAIRQQTDQVLPAEAKKQAEQYRARGQAAAIRERGQAVGEAINLLNQAWLDAGDEAVTIYLIGELEKIFEQVADGVRKVQVDHINLIDGGRGETLAAYVGAYPAMMRAIFDALAATTGIDVPRLIAGNLEGDDGWSGASPAGSSVTSPQTTIPRSSQQA
ncbi:MAG: hypothetical protein JW797_19545 [Bradymonadales bacterium]|nr:hypothetical protein [Bradymonadales bacterium]